MILLVLDLVKICRYLWFLHNTGCGSWRAYCVRLLNRASAQTLLPEVIEVSMLVTFLLLRV